MEGIKESFNYSWSDKFEIEDLENRRLYLNDQIDEVVITSLVYHILRYNRLDKDLKKEDRKPIILYINSPGGVTYDGYGLISAITESITPVYTVNLGMCASMAFLCFIAGAKRYSMKNSTFLMHEGIAGGFDNTSKMRDRIEFETGQLELHTKNFVLEHTNISSKHYDEKYRIEWYMLPEEAQKYSICDYIVGKDCTINDII